MSESISTFHKTVKLQAHSLEEARPIRAALDKEVLEAVVSLTTHEPGLEPTRTSDQDGNCQVHATAHGYDIMVTTRSGQDTVFQGTERRTFISYTISAQSTMRSLNRAASVAREMSVILRGLGALTFAGLLPWGIGALLEGTGIMSIKLPIAIVIGVVVAGAWLGERLGHFLGAKLEARAWSRVESSGAMPQLELLWQHLEQRFNRLLQPYERI